MNNDLGEIECFVLFCFHFGTFSHLSWHYKLSSSLLEVHIYTFSEDVYICQMDVTEYEYITIARKVHRASFMYALSFLSASKRHADRWIGNSKLRQGVSECACVCVHGILQWIGSPSRVNSPTLCPVLLGMALGQAEGVNHKLQTGINKNNKCWSGIEKQAPCTSQVEINYELNQ